MEGRGFTPRPGEDPLDSLRWDSTPLDWSRPIAAKTRDLSGYAGSLACKACHEPLYATYAKHSMARTGMRPVESAGFDALFDAANDVDHVRSGFRYRPVRRGKQYFVSETLLGTDGKPVATWEEPVTHVFSAGSYGLALYSRRNGRLIHLPIDYYAQAKQWDLDPMAFGGNPRMNVQLDTFCISCHSDEPAKRYDDPLPGGIGCERCHGPSKKHVVSQKPEDTIGPAQLSMRRQLDLCTQCHESTFEQQRPGRDHFDYHPGEPLDAFRVNFVEDPPNVDHVKLLAHPERLVRSACWRGGKLTCTTCHDPHVSSLDEPAAYWDGKCLGCHDKQACTDTPAHRATEGDHCWHCHMQRGPTSKMPLVTITDHWIQKRPVPMKPDAPVTPRSLIAWSTFIGEPVPDEAALARAYADAGLMDEAVKHAVTGDAERAAGGSTRGRVPREASRARGRPRVSGRAAARSRRQHGAARLRARDAADGRACRSDARARAHARDRSAGRRGAGDVGHLPRANRRSGARTRPVPAGSRHRARERDRLRRAGGDGGSAGKNAVAAEGVSSRAARPVGG